MQQLLEEIWTAIQVDLRSQAGEAAYEAWLRDLRPMALERGICYLEAKNRMAAEHVQRLHETLLADRLSDAFGTRLTVTVLSAPGPTGVDELEVGPARPVLDASNKAAMMTLQVLAHGEEFPTRQCLLHGPRGSGKSYLLRWFIGQLEQKPKVFSGERLIAAFQSCLRDRRVAELRSELAEAPVLVLDELHRVAGHQRIQAELAGVLDARAQAGAPTVLGSRHHPRSMWRTSEQLQSVLLAGIVSELGMPGPTARLQYLRALEGPPSRNGRAADIERLARDGRGSFVDLRRSWLTEREGLGQTRYLRLIDPRTTFDETLGRVCKQYGITADALMGKSQERRLSLARQVLAYVCVELGLNRAEVGRFMHNRSRASVSYMTRALETRMSKDDDLRREVEELLP